MAKRTKKKDTMVELTYVDGDDETTPSWAALIPLNTKSENVAYRKLGKFVKQMNKAKIDV